ncbi:hypothetical protein LTR36_005237 [Oleoguttula mirabilis]|uniref:Cytochrome b5 heme-binding domain-containing protein n=1 Tax=Oleoguttula mirabilis TaxID=1507867 RepID=A0AAV9JWE4_9PEZI|nr:hypothetical protein LTR36_005237 [Oleoguttula mirabilis]
MGRIRLASFRAQRTLPKEKPMMVNEKLDAGEVEQIECVEVKTEDSTNPFLPKRTKEKDLPFIPPTEVRKRDGKGDSRLWIVVDTVVLDVTEYQNQHPGGRSIIAGFRGQDCSWQWWSFHDRTIWQSIAGSLRVGRTVGVENPHRRPRTIVGLRKHGFDDWD